MRSRREVIRRSNRRRLVGLPAQNLPFADGSVDTVVSTFVLCTAELPISPCGRSRGVASRRPAALYRARPFQSPGSPVARSPGPAVVSVRERLPLQSGDCGADATSGFERRCTGRHGAACRPSCDPSSSAAHKARDHRDRASRRRGLGDERNWKWGFTVAASDRDLPSSRTAQQRPGAAAGALGLAPTWCRPFVRRGSRELLRGRVRTG
jgi:hypothetical protein